MNCHVVATITMTSATTDNKEMIHGIIRTHGRTSGWVLLLALLLRTRRRFSLGVGLTDEVSDEHESGDG